MADFEKIQPLKVKLSKHIKLYLYQAVCSKLCCDNNKQQILVAYRKTGLYIAHIISLWWND